MQFNGMALCPAVVYLDKFGVPEAALCEGSTLHVMTGNKPPLRTGPDTVNFEILPVLETTHCRRVNP